jgi:hypothetical protein
LPNYFTDNLIANGNVVESYGVNALKNIPENIPAYAFNKTFNGYIRMSNSIAKKICNKV